jgi:peroxiredoxin
LQAYQAILPDIRALGGTVVALSPEGPSYTAHTASTYGIEFDVCSDPGNEVARRFGLVFRFSPELVESYLSMGRSLEELNGDDSWELPIPGAYVVDRDGVIRAAHVDADYTTRMEPDTVLAALRSLV